MGASPASSQSISQRLRQATDDLACVPGVLRARQAENSARLTAVVDRIERSLDGDLGEPYESPCALLGETRDLARERGQEFDVLLAGAARTLNDLDRLAHDLITLD